MKTGRTTNDASVAQLVERRLDMADVAGSSPVGSTKMDRSDSNRKGNQRGLARMIILPSVITSR